ncbi:MAG: ParB/RepB/Spo0J family partition protein [Pseudomonadota bacterium]
MAPRKPKPPTLDEAQLKAEDAGYTLAKKNAVQYIHSRRQAIFSVARHYHLDADDLHQEAYEVLLTCLRDFNPIFTKATGEVVSVLFNTFFGNRLESRALEMRNRDPEYQARQAHMAEMSDTDREEFRRNPPLLVQHLDQETTLQETLRGEVSAAQSRQRVNVLAKTVQDGFIEQKLDALIAAERDEKRRAALQHVKAGGVSSFEEIAFHFGVTDSRASQIFNELMDVFYVQRLIAGDLKSVAYDFRKLGLNDKRAARLLEEAVQEAVKRGDAQRGHAIVGTFGPEHPTLAKLLALVLKDNPAREQVTTTEGPVLPAQLSAAEEEAFPLVEIEMREVKALYPLEILFRPLDAQPAEDLPHIRDLTRGEPEVWPPLLVTPEGGIIDGERRVLAARARGVKRLLCQVRQTPEGMQGLQAAKQLRVVMNSRVRTLSKVELYYAIVALLQLGLAQGKIAELLGTSRPNVIVYAKLHTQGSARMKTLFEDGILQITNASSAVDLPPEAQDALADFIKQNGAVWTRGPQFAEAYAAAAAGQLASLAPAGSAQPMPAQVGKIPSLSTIPAMPSLAGHVGQSGGQGAGVGHEGGGLSPVVAQALKRRQEALENALADAEVWAKQREATIGSQAVQLQELRGAVESLKRELEAQALMQVADEASVASYVKDMKAFYALQERLAAAKHQLEAAGRQWRSLNLTHRQNRELEPMLEAIATLHTALRVQLVRPAGHVATGAVMEKTPSPTE